MIPKNNEDFLMTIIGNNMEILNINNSILNSYNNSSLAVFKDFAKEKSKKYNFEIVFSSNFNNMEEESESNKDLEDTKNINYRIFFTEETEKTRLKYEFYFNNEEYEFNIPTTKNNFPEIQVSISTTVMKDSYYQVSHLIINIDSGGFNVIKQINPDMAFDSTSGRLDLDFFHINNAFVVRHLRTNILPEDNKKYSDIFNKYYNIFAESIINNKKISTEQKDMIFLESDITIPDISISYLDLSLKELISKKVLNSKQTEALKRKLQ